MIYTVTFNPSLDYVVSVNDFEIGKTNRTCEETIFPGGKGINVSMVLENLGMENTALGFLAGFVGREIERRVSESGIHAEFIHLPEGNSRINVKLKNFDGTEINGMGPHIPEHKLAALRARIDRLKAGDVLVLAGSIPGSIPSSIYSELMARVAGKDVLCIIDATKELLLESLEYHPFLVKPNNHELGELFGVNIMTREEAIPYAKEMQRLGARNVLVSMSGQGAVFAGEDGQVYESPAPSGTLINAVGAGDSMVAGFLAGWLSSGDYRHAFFMGLSAGSASAFSQGLADGAKIERVYRSICECLEEKE